MRVIVLVTHQHSLARPPHPVLIIVLLQSSESCQHRRVLFGLVLFRAEGVVAERKQPYFLGLICSERLRQDGTGGRLISSKHTLAYLQLTGTSFAGR